MAAQGLQKIVAEHRFFAGLDEVRCAVVCGCAKNVRFEPGRYLVHEGDRPGMFYLLRQGRVALEVFSPRRGAVTLQTLVEGEIIGVSWLVPPYRSAYDARALDRVRAVTMDAKCLQQKCDANSDLG